MEMYFFVVVVEKCWSNSRSIVLKESSLPWFIIKSHHWLLLFWLSHLKPFQVSLETLQVSLEFPHFCLDRKRTLSLSSYHILTGQREQNSGAWGLRAISGWTDMYLWSLTASFSFSVVSTSDLGILSFLIPVLMSNQLSSFPDEQETSLGSQLLLTISGARRLLPQSFI